MAIALPQSVKKILEDKAYGHVITFGASGKPQVTMVWVDVDGDEVVFNTAEGRLKPKNLQRDPPTARRASRRPEPTPTSTSSPSASWAPTSTHSAGPGRSG